MQLRDFTEARTKVLERRLKPPPNRAADPAATALLETPDATTAGSYPSPRAVGLAIAFGIIIGGGGGIMLDIAAAAALILLLITVIFRALRRPRDVSEALAESAETEPAMTDPSAPSSGFGVTRLAIRTALVVALVAVGVVAVLDRDGALNHRVRDLAAAYAPAGGQDAHQARAAPAEVLRGGREFAATREITLRKQSDGHFYMRLEVNGREIDFLVDTGASMVALTQQDAERAGLRPRTLRYDGVGSTAGGTVAMASVSLRQIRAGQFTAYDVDAAVLDSPMRISLLGMTFLRELESFEVRGDRLILRY